MRRCQMPMGGAWRGAACRGIFASINPATKETRAAIHQAKATNVGRQTGRNAVKDPAGTKGIFLDVSGWPAAGPFVKCKARGAAC